MVDARDIKIKLILGSTLNQSINLRTIFVCLYVTTLGSTKDSQVEPLTK